MGQPHRLKIRESYPLIRKLQKYTFNVGAIGRNKFLVDVAAMVSNRADWRVPTAPIVHLNAARVLRANGARLFF